MRAVICKFLFTSILQRNLPQFNFLPFARENALARIKIMPFELQAIRVLLLFTYAGIKICTTNRCVSIP